MNDQKRNRQMISTPWKENLSLDLPLPEHPRPQMVRSEWKNLNGVWSFCITGKDSEIPEVFDREILVPFALETELSGANSTLSPDERLWYRRAFSIPENWYDKRIILHFEAVDWQCICFVNGQRIGEHCGGYVPFSFDLTNAITEGENEIILSVWDPTDSHWQQAGKQALAPKGIYYTATSGIWQTVWLEPTTMDNHIADLRLTPGQGLESIEIVVKSRIAGRFSAIVFENEREICRADGRTDKPLVVPIPRPRLWSPDDPFLYEVAIQLTKEDHVVDSVKSYFGLRSIKTAESASGHRRIFLNGAPLFLHGPLDQGYWPESGMTAPCEEAVLFDLQKMKEMGFNMVRKHVKVECRRWYYHADRLGLVVIQDMVNSSTSLTGDLASTFVIAFDRQRKRDNNAGSYRKAGRETSESRLDFEHELIDVMDHLHNSPALLIWVPFNEAWGQFDSERITGMMRQHDPTRLIDHASGWFDQGCGDFRSRHRYVLKLKKPPSSDKRVYFVSEYGGYSFRLNGHIWDPDRDFKYKIFKERSALEQAYRSLMRKQIIPLIRKGLGAAVYTQLADVEIECNGLFTFDRKILKINANLVRSLNEEIYHEFKKCEE